MQREKFGTRLGFILISAGCAIGLGNVWRFPYITGAYGGAAFVLFYLFFLVILAMPIMAMEFSVGRASQKSAARSFHVLESNGSHWHIHGYFAMAGNYLLMMFYTTVAGWMLNYLYRMASGKFVGLNADEVGAAFDASLASPGTQIFWMVLVVILGFGVCSRGLQNGVEKITKPMMLALLGLMIALAIRAVTLSGAESGLLFYLKPDFHKMAEIGVGEVIYAAMGQAFFTLSLGIGSMAMFGSYIDKTHSLSGEAIYVTALDTFVALMAGLIIFPSCAAYGVHPNQGPGLLFVTLPNVFNGMPGGRFWGALFFVFMSFAAMSTVIAVFENIISYGMDLFGWSRKKAVAINFVAIILLSLPCALGSNLWSGISLPHLGGVLDIEDFLVSTNLLPLGSVVYLLFCTHRYGWGYDNFLLEANAGNGLKFPGGSFARVYFSYIVPLVVVGIWVVGIWQKFSPQG